MACDKMDLSEALKARRTVNVTNGIVVLRARFAEAATQSGRVVRIWGSDREFKASVSTLADVF
jgi:hypothetical protein